MDTLTVLDTDVFIDHFRGLAAATVYLQALRVTQRATTDVTVMELYKGALNREQLTAIVRFLERNHVTRLPVSAAASQRAVALLHDYGLSHGLGIPDALIAAMALAYAWSRRRTGFPNRILPRRVLAHECTARLWPCSIMAASSTMMLVLRRQWRDSIFAHHKGILPTRHPSLLTGADGYESPAASPRLNTP